MKTIFIFLCIAGASCIYLVSCAKAPKTVYTTVMLDRTDTSLILNPEIDKIETFFEVSTQSHGNIETGNKVRVVDITGVDYSLVKEINIDPVNENNVNTLLRKKEIQQFFDKFSDAVLSKPIGNYHQSSVYLPIVRELNRLSKQPSGETKLVVIYSDLFENNDVFNSYKNIDIPIDKIISALDKYASLDDLTGISVYIRYIPKNETDNKRYRIMSNVYKLIFESKGAKVFFEF